MHPIEKLKGHLARLGSEGLLRIRTTETPAPAPALIDVSSNDYLGYGRASVSRETATMSGGRASRLIHGTHAAHRLLETELADWVSAQDSLLFSSGYAANLGVLAAVAGPGDVIISDELNHASIVDGCRLSRARVVIVPHRDLDAVEKALVQTEDADARWVVTESYFSMDGDSPDLPRLRALCDAAGAGLYVDEAHALGIFGPEGAGLCRTDDVRADVLVGTLGKAVGVQGAFVAGAPELLDYVWNRARSFVYSTAVSPLLAEVALGHVRRIRKDESARDRLRSLSARLRELLSAHQELPESSFGPIFPLVLGTAERALASVRVLRDAGFSAVAIRPPTVPVGRCRLRVSLNATLTDDQLTRLAAAIRQCLAS